MTMRTVRYQKVCRSVLVLDPGPDLSQMVGYSRYAHGVCSARGHAPRRGCLASPQNGDLSNISWEIEVIVSVWVTWSPVTTYHTDKASKGDVEEILGSTGIPVIPSKVMDSSEFYGNTRALTRACCSCSGSDFVSITDARTSTSSSRPSNSSSNAYVSRTLSPRVSSFSPTSVPISVVIASASSSSSASARTLACTPASTTAGNAGD